MLSPQVLSIFIKRQSYNIFIKRRCTVTLFSLSHLQYIKKGVSLDFIKMLLIFSFVDEQTGDTKALITTKPSSCKDVRVSKVYRDVTLKGGISSGDFTDKGHVTSMDECINKCCGTDTCNVAFVIKDTCFTVKCSSYDDCALKSAVSEYYSPKIAYINWNPPKDDLGETGMFTLDIYHIYYY